MPQITSVLAALRQAVGKPLSSTPKVCSRTASFAPCQLRHNRQIAFAEIAPGCIIYGMLTAKKRRKPGRFAS